MFLPLRAQSKQREAVKKRKKKKGVNIPLRDRLECLQRAERLAMAAGAQESEELSAERLWEAGVMAGEQLPNVFQLDCLAKLHYERNCGLAEAHHTEGMLPVKV